MRTGVRLERATRAHADLLVAMAEEFRDEGDPRYAPLLADVEAFFLRMDWFARGIDITPGLVQQTTFLLFDNDRLLGSSRLRHRLIPVLHLDGGNVGYEIRRSERGRGYGTRILALTLGEARGIGLDRALLTAAATNVASIRVIEKNGGVADGTSVSPHTGEVMRRFWIQLQVVRLLG